MSDALSTIALGVNTKDALDNFRALQVEIAKTKEAIATLDAGAAMSGSGSGMMRGVASIITEIKKLNTQFDDLTARLGKAGGQGQKAVGGLNEELQKAVQNFMATKQGAEAVTKQAFTLEQAVTATGRAIGRMNAEGESSARGYTQALQGTISYTNLVAKAQDDLNLKLLKQKATQEALANSEHGKAQLDQAMKYRSVQQQMTIAEVERAEQARATGRTMVMEELNRRQQGIKTAREMQMAELDRAQQAVRTSREMQMAEADRAKEALRAANAIKIADIERNEQLRIARANTDYLTASEKERLRTAQRAAQYARQDGVTPRMVQVQYGTMAAGDAMSPARMRALEQAVAGTRTKIDDARKSQHEWNRAMHDGHSAVRGLAGGFQMMWLTWGQIAPLLAGFAISTAIKNAAQNFIELNYQMTFTKELAEGTQYTVQEMIDMTHDNARALGIMTGEAAGGLRTLAQAGLNVDQAFFALPDTFKLATVGEMEMGQAAIALTGILNSFGKSVAETAKLSDMLTKTGSMSATSIQNLTEAMKYASPTAHQFKVDIGETLTILDALAKRNITGSAAGTATKNMIKEMAAPSTDEVKRIFKDLFDFSAYDASGKLKPVLQQVDELRVALSKYDRESQGKLLRTMFGEKGDKAFFALMAEGTQQLEANLGRIQDSMGFTDQVFMNLQQTVRGQFKLMASEIDSALGKAGQAGKAELVQVAREIRMAFASPELQSALTGLVQSVATLGVAVVTHGKEIVMFLGAIAGYRMVGAALMGIAAGAVALRNAVIGAGGAMAALSTLMMATPWGRILGAVVGLAGGYLLLRERKQSMVDKAGEENRSIAETIKKMDEEIQRLAKRNELLAKGIALKDLDAGAAVLDAERVVYDQAMARNKLAGEIAVLEKSSEFGAAAQLNAKRQQLKVMDKSVAEAQANFEQVQYSMKMMQQQRLTEEEHIARLNREEAARANANLPAGTLTYDKPDKAAAVELDKVRDQRKQEILQQYRFERGLANDQYAFETKLANDKFRAGVVELQAYLDEMSVARHAYRMDQEAAEKKAIDGLNSLKGGAKGSDVAELDNAAKKIKQDEDQAQAKKLKNDQMQIENDLIRVQTDMLKVQRDTLPKMGREFDNAHKREVEAQAIALLTQEEQNLANGRRQAEDQYNSLIGNLEQELMLVNVRVMMADRMVEAAQKEGDAEAEKLAKIAAARARTAQGVVSDTLRDVNYEKDKAGSKGYGNAKQLNEVNKWNLALERSVSIATKMETAFGRVGRAVGGLTTSMIRMAKEEKDVERAKEQRIKEALKGGGGREELLRIEQEASKESAEAQIRNYADIMGAAKSFFKEGSKGYETLQAAEQAFRAFELAQAISNMMVKAGLIQQDLAMYLFGNEAKTASDATYTTATLAYEGEKQIAKGTTAVLTQGEGDPYTAFARMAMMAAVVASLGVAISGGRGGSPGALYKDRQKNQSKGSVLGMEDEVSKSMDNSLQRMQDNSYIELTQQQEMIANLVGIKEGIGRLTRTLVTTMPGARGTPTDLLAGGFGSWESDFWGFNSGSRELLDAGIVQEWAQRNSIGAMRNGQRMNLSQYQDIYEEESSWWGLDVDTEQYRNTWAAPDEFTRQLSAVIVQMGDTLADAAVGLGYGEQFIRDRLNSMEVSFGGLSLQGMNAEEAEQAINDRMNQLADSMTNSLIGGWIGQFQQAGEGMAETLLRVSNDVMVARYELDKLGVSMVSLESITNKTGDIGAELVRESVMDAELINRRYQTLFTGFSGWLGNLMGQIEVMVPEYTGIGRLMENMQGSATELAAAYRQLKDIQKIVRQTSGSMNANWFGAEAIRGAGGLEEFARGIEAFQNEFYSEDAVRRMKLDSLNAEFRALGVWVPKTREDFRRLVLSFSANTEMYGKLISMADEFADAVEESAERALTAEEQLEKTSGYVDDLTNSAQRMQDVARNARELSRTIAKDLGGNADVQSEINRVKLAMQSTLSVEQEMELAQELHGLIMDRYSTEIDALQEVVNLGKELQDYADALILGEASPLTAAQKFGTARSEYENLLARARSGDNDALGKLQGAADTYLELARTMFASSDQYTSVFNSVYTALQGLALNTTGNSQQRIEELQQAQKAELTALKLQTDAIAAQANTYYQQHIGILAQQLQIEQQQAVALGQLPTMNDRLREMPAALAATLARYLGVPVNDTIPVNGSHAGGLQYVPFDGYIAELHRGERVLTAAEAGASDSSVQDELRSLRALLETLISEQRQQTGDLIRAAYDSTDRSAEKVVEGQKEAVENAEWKSNAKVGVV